MTKILYYPITPLKIALTAAAALLCALVITPISVTRAETTMDQVHLSSAVVCAPGSHSSCTPGPFTELLTLDHPAQVIIDVYLTHTGHYEDNEQSSFSSPIGDLARLRANPTRYRGNFLWAGQWNSKQ